MRAAQKPAGASAGRGRGGIGDNSKRASRASVAAFEAAQQESDNSGLLRTLGRPNLSLKRTVDLHRGLAVAQARGDALTVRRIVKELRSRRLA